MSPLRHQGFRVLLTGRLINELAYWFAAIALAVLVYDETGSALATAALFVGMEFLPALVTPAVVARVELLSTRRGLATLYAIEAAALGAVALVADDFRLPLIVLLAAIDGTVVLATRALGRATAAAVLAPLGQLRDGNALLNVSVTVAAAAGPALAGIVVAGSGLAIPFVVAAALLLVVAAMLLFARGLPATPTEREPHAEQRLGRRLREGFSYLAGRPVLRALFFGEVTAYLFFTAVLPIEIVLVKETLGGDDGAYGALLASWGVGMVVGSFVFVGASRVPLWLPLLSSTLAIAISYVAIGASPTIAFACAGAVLGGLGNGVQTVALLNAVQEETEAAFQARVLGMLESVGSVMTGLGFIVGGVIATVLGPRQAFFIAAVGIAAVALVVAVALRRAGWSGTPATASAPPALSPIERGLATDPAPPG